MDNFDRIQNGIKFLDQSNPGWENEVDTDILALDNCFRCVLGQTYGEFWAALDVLCDVPFSKAEHAWGTPQYEAYCIARDKAVTWARAHGFMITEHQDRDGRPATWHDLTADWITAIEKHRVRETVDE